MNSDRVVIASGALALLGAMIIPAQAYQRPGATSQVSLSTGGAQGSGDSGFSRRGVAMTPDARYVAFQSLASNLVPGDTNRTDDIVTAG
jgi:hypothetical protein